MKNFLHCSRAEVAVEYALIVALIAVVIIGALFALSDNVIAMFTHITTSVQAALSR